MKIKAWHRVHEHLSPTHFLTPSEDVELGVTHVCLPTLLVTTEVFEHTESYLGQAFTHFNWVHDFDDVAALIQAFVRSNNTHTSMSVGDIVELVDLNEFYMVQSFGWKKLDIKNSGKDS